MITAKEIKLGQTKYFILQYLRTNPGEYSAKSLAKELELSHKTIASHLKDMVEMDILSEEPMKNGVRDIKIKPEWLH